MLEERYCFGFFPFLLDETDNHLLFHYIKSQTLWNWLFNLFGICCVISSSIKDYLLGCDWEMVYKGMKVAPPYILLILFRKCDSFQKYGFVNTKYKYTSVKWMGMDVSDLIVNFIFWLGPCWVKLIFFISPAFFVFLAWDALSYTSYVLLSMSFLINPYLLNLVCILWHMTYLFVFLASLGEINDQLSV